MELLYKNRWKLPHADAAGSRLSSPSSLSCSPLFDGSINRPVEIGFISTISGAPIGALALGSITDTS